MAQSNHAAGVDVPVLIAGAGPVGLLTSILLSRQGIRNLVLEKREQINGMPRARGINVRSVEILTNLDLGAKLASESLPPLWTQRFVYTETMAGEIVGMMPGNMASGTVAAFSPCDYRVAAQDRLDPMLYEKAITYPQAVVAVAACAILPPSERYIARPIIPSSLRSSTPTSAATPAAVRAR
jgi:2-polyprenyl-6-methoxyphenol hydroxylase-like FAD-dependent oxidoreductase